MTRPDAAALHDTVEIRLRAVGHRYTARRRELVEALRHAGNPMSIPDVLAGRRALPQSSVYRNMSVLEQAGVVHRVITEGGFARFELGEDLSEHHHHVVCRICGAVEDVTIPARLERSVERALADIAEQTGFEGVSHRLDLIGTCRSCS